MSMGPRRHQVGGTRSAAPRSRSVSSPASAHPLLALQSTAGNRAVSQLVAGDGPALQRLDVTSKQLDQVLGTESKLRGRIGHGQAGHSSFGAIRHALRDYEAASTPRIQQLRLQRLDDLCTMWLNEHRAPKAPRDQQRRALLSRLSDELALERMKLSRNQAQDSYMEAVNSSGKKNAGPNAFEALSFTGMSAGRSAPKGEGAELAKAKGLSPAEVAAIRIFSAADYTYINPAMANSSSWMQSQKKDSKDSLHDLSGHADKTLREEGGLHGGMAMGGLNKLEPWTKPTYRGARYTPDEFKSQFQVGKSMSFNSFASSAQEESTAVKFAHGVGIEGKISKEKEIAVVSVIRNSGGRDISALSVTKGEKEVMLLPGSKFVIFSLHEVDGASEYADIIEMAQGGAQPLPKKWYVAELVPLPKGPAPSPPTGTPAPRR